MANETVELQEKLEEEEKPSKLQQLKMDQTKYIKKVKYTQLDTFFGVFSVCAVIMMLVGLVIHIVDLREIKYKNGAEIAELHRNQTDMMAWISDLINKELNNKETIAQLREAQSEYISEINDLWHAKSNNIRQIDELQTNQSYNIETINTQQSKITQLEDEVQELTELISNLEADKDVTEVTTPVLGITTPVLTTMSIPAVTSAPKVATQKTETTNHVHKTTKLDKTTSTPTPCQDCAEHFYRGNTKDGVYTIYPGGQPVDVYCDMSSQGSIVLQKRYDGSLDFSKTFKQYSKGFGNLTGEHWLGLDNVHRITETGNWTLTIELKSFENEIRYAEYLQFRIGAAPGFQLFFDTSSYRGNAGNSGKYKFDHQHGCRFTTLDRDQDEIRGYNCANVYGGGGWWYNGVKACAVVTTTGMPYSRGINSIMWYPWKKAASLKSVTLKIKKM